MGLFDFLFGSDKSSFNAEDYRSIHEDRVIALNIGDPTSFVSEWGEEKWRQTK